MNFSKSGKVGIVLIDHGSRRRESNDMLLEAAEVYRQMSKWTIVEPAHMELAEPSLADAFDRCVEQGAELVVVFPYFLSPGRHWNEDIPQLAVAAAEKHQGVRYLVTAPFGLHPLLLQVIGQRIDRCIQQSEGLAGPCDFCDDDSVCVVKEVEDETDS